MNAQLPNAAELSRLPLTDDAKLLAKRLDGQQRKALDRLADLVTA